ncbi:beta-xylosidase family glycoside hydrolase [Niabella ginsengisoli]|uniref:Beta-xylosidase C-terminal Concanavalin A-like domain-containing protein n=1 Tax=Niabella ginsengisoli TaxID=522298 RepID=A0ABS9SKH9_9BACT|nr:hypothetical protein [Niabella ginsengisoli]MCH5598876.1 hypothetical protein [Niabella ginsengisoli]
MEGKNQWPVFKELSGNSYPTGVTDNFFGKTPALHWQWDFRNASPNVKQDNGKLLLSGTTNADNKTGIALTLRPALPYYEMQVTVVNENNAVKGLTVYGDVKMAVGLGVTNNNIEYWYVKDGKREVLASSLIRQGPVQLKMAVSEDLQVSYKQGSNKWQTLTPNKEISFDALSPWDRSSRMGLHFLGNPEEQAVFKEFKLIYQQ